MLSTCSGSAVVTDSTHAFVSATHKINLPAESIFTEEKSSAFRLISLEINLTHICHLAYFYAKDKNLDFAEVLRRVFDEYIEFLENKNRYEKHYVGLEQQVTVVVLRDSYFEYKDYNLSYVMAQHGGIFIQELSRFLENEIVFLYKIAIFSKLGLQIEKIDNQIFSASCKKLQCTSQLEIFNGEGCSEKEFNCKIDMLHQYNKHFLSLSICLPKNTAWVSSRISSVINIPLLKILELHECDMSLEECCVLLQEIQKKMLFRLIFVSTIISVGEEKNIEKIVDLLLGLLAEPDNDLTIIALDGLEFKSKKVTRSFNPYEAVRFLTVLSHFSSRLNGFSIRCDLEDSAADDQFFLTYSKFLSNPRENFKGIYLYLKNAEKLNSDLDFSCFFKALKNNNTLKAFSLVVTSEKNKRASLKEKQATSLIDFLGCNDEANKSTLTWLNLSNWSIPDALEKQFFVALKDNKFLLALDIGVNGSYGSQDIIANKFSDELSNVLGKNKTLHCVRPWTSFFIPPLRIREKEADMLSQNEHRYISTGEIWGAVSVLIAFSRANRQAFFRNSILSLIPSIIRLNKVMPDRVYHKLSIQDNKKRSYASLS